MQMRAVIAVVSRITFFIGIAMLFPIGWALASGEGCWRPIALAMAVTLGMSGLVALIARIPREELSHRQGMMIVTLSWIAAGLFGALPFFFADVFGPPSVEGFVNCFFESISGFTTTGSSVLGGAIPIESLPRGLLFWRSLTHWLGGMGIIVLAVAILPLLGVGGTQLIKAESAITMQERLRPRVRQTAALLWTVYAMLTAVGVFLLMLGGMDLFDALCHSFAAVATGGFSTRDASIEAFQSPYIESVCMVLMLAGATSFALHYRALTCRITAYFRDSQFRYFLAFMVGGCLFVSGWLYASGTYPTIFSALRYGCFQAISILSTTGYSTADFGRWSFVLQLLLVAFMFTGSSVGSTSGAIKTMRIVLLFKYVYREFVRLIHPKAFAAVKIGGEVVHKDVIESVLGFFILYIAVFVVSSLVLAGTGLDLVSSCSATATTMGGVGPGLGTVGPAGNFSGVPLSAKMILSLCMILGRLEIYTVLILFVPEYWRK